MNDFGNMSQCRSPYEGSNGPCGQEESLARGRIGVKFSVLEIIGNVFQVPVCLVQEVSDPPITTVRSTHDKALLVISEGWHFNGMWHFHQIKTNSTAHIRHRLHINRVSEGVQNVQLSSIIGKWYMVLHSTYSFNDHAARIYIMHLHSEDARTICTRKHQEKRKMVIAPNYHRLDRPCPRKGIEGKGEKFGAITSKLPSIILLP